ncbi:SPOR domain-containing protein [Erythrobacter rubeus]|uniref:Tetratricopeptide repeat protein n=1 Tax=Erythrobacter rubeus TaxID=2760803 RepID=A0ABR8KSV4_9SPHN|nr:SPOR domain-containing protein [Erythrobacter rubeus]MBD2842670.1 tetratricopeptide repeat protein [Erythrobacter rubeus]
MSDTGQGIKTMVGTDSHNEKGTMISPKMGLIMTTALASVALTGCTTSVAAPAHSSFAKAQIALEKGQVDKAVTHAEAAVLSEPRNPGFRAMLGAAYLEAGRFDSAATSFKDALELGDEDPRTVLSYALAKTAVGSHGEAVAMLRNWEAAINPADLGLALALAGQPERGVHVLTNALRGGQNTAKVRQNLAYTYALAGNWRAARVMAAEDVPANELDTRLSSWAANARPEDHQVRVASLLGVNPTSDGGQPTHLALANFPSQDMLVAESAAQAPEEVAADLTENEPAVEAAPAVAEATVAPVPAAQPAAKPARRYISEAVVQKLPEKAVKKVAAKPAPKKAPARIAKSPSQRRMAVASGKAATHLVQLGSFESRAIAESKWNEFKSKFPQLKQHDVVITEAVVNGTTYFRVAAAGFGQATASQMCSAVKSTGRGCFAYAASNPPAGAVDRGVRIAARTR